ncbi:hypothetical protein GCM10007973_21910 [Polymorphobacter multimanifer]|uniref:amidohydrolase family protein n=1 Tax=Polymorphobacter multimanifer TaxID=1070431 RepID=UPI0019BCAD12|nr:amidohydrolase family protein [Polymorphobacter multimanifer]GGI84915.1 hypothetical protein GCM10007973_21910 [Polymorphobacter multimanifer]
MWMVLVLAGAVLLGAAGPAKLDMSARLLPPAAVPGPAVAPFVKVPAGRTAIVHVNLIDGTGAPAMANRTVLIEGNRIMAVQAGDAPVPAGYRQVDGQGRSLMPGLIGMHDHQYYISRPNLDAALKSEPPLIIPQMAFSSPRLYLAGGVTTIRTGGSVEPFSDLNMKTEIDAGRLPGPRMDVTAPYLEGMGSPFVQMGRLNCPAAATAMVNYWADQGVTSFKAYMFIDRASLAAAIAAAHARGIKVTGHLCAVTYAEAAALGIDNLEHGFFANTGGDPGKVPDVCPPTSGGPTLSAMTADSVAAKELIATLVAKRVALTSTLPVFEPRGAKPRPLSPRQLAVMTPQARTDYLYPRLAALMFTPERAAAGALQWRNGMALERAFVAAGGLLIAGPDPTGAGRVLPGFGGQRGIALLVEAGFAPLEAIRIGTLNGAIYLGVDAALGSIAVGKVADLVLVKGDPSRRIDDIENVEIVFKDGIGYDSAALLETVQGRYGQY